MPKRRARTDEDKRARLTDIFDAARGVFDTTEVDGFTMEAVAVELGLAKGTLYRYVPTREALLLALTTDEYSRWFDTVDSELPRGADVASTLVSTLLGQPRFMRLLSLLASIFERNIPFDTARNFKLMVVTRGATTATLLSPRLGCSAERALQLLVHVQALTIGLYQLANPSPVVTEVLTDPAFGAMHIDLAAELEHGVRALVVAATE